MSKVLFDVLLPATGRHYDFWVPEDMPLGEIGGLVADAMQVAEPSFYSYSDNALLMHVATGRIVNARLTAEEQGFFDGERFVLL